MEFLGGFPTDPLHFHRFALEQVLFSHNNTGVVYIDTINAMRSYITDIAWCSTRNESFNPITVNRNVVCLREWAWILCDDEAMEFLIRGENFDPLGIPMLRYMCEKYEIPIPGDEYEER